MSHYVQPQHEHDPDPLEGRTALVQGGLSFHEITEKVARVIEHPHRNWWLAFVPSVALLGVFVISIAWLFWEGVGIWGHNNPVMWAWPIITFVFWVGIGHAGTLISAILFLFRQKWRTSINRGAEAMTIFAVICALMFPTIHVGRVWALYWALPIPNQMQMWPNFRSPLLWDVFAVSTYFTVSLLFWYVGLIPDLATMRDRAKTRIRQVAYGIFALGWRGSHRHWVNYESAYLLLAAMATPLVLSVHSIVSFDFAVSQLPGWHTTIFPPYFVAGAIFSGFGMVLTLMIPLRKWFGLEQIITIKHLENMAKIILLTGSMVGYAYGLEFFIAWYSGNPLETFAFFNRAFGDYSWAYWIMMSCNVITPQLIWFKGVRRSPTALFVLSIFVNIGMWFERFVIVVTSLHHDFLPSSWDYFSPTAWDWATLVGSFGLFFTLFLLFLRYLPLIAITEVKAVTLRANPHYVDPGDGDDDGHGHSHDRVAAPTSAKLSGPIERAGVVDSVHDDDDDPGPGGDSRGGAKVVVKAPPKADSPANGDDDDGPTKVDRSPISSEALLVASEAAAAARKAADNRLDAAKKPADDGDAAAKADANEAVPEAGKGGEDSKQFKFSPPKLSDQDAGEGGTDKE